MSHNQDVTYEKAFDFAIKVVEQARAVSQSEKEFVMTKQLLKSGTSIGANVAESKGSISKAEYSMKILRTTGRK